MFYFGSQSEKRINTVKYIHNFQGVIMNQSILHEELVSYVWYALKLFKGVHRDVFYIEF